jgi:hypothetical protein
MRYWHLQGYPTEELTEHCEVCGCHISEDEDFECLVCLEDKEEEQSL